MRQQMFSATNNEKVKNMSSYIFGFEEIDKTMIATVGGKAASLGELCKIEGIYVPEGFCISTDAFRKIISKDASIDTLLDQLSSLMLGDRHKIITLSAEIRHTIEQISIPKD